MSIKITSTTLIGGDSGSGKTSLLATLARHIYRRTKGVTRVYVTDGGLGVALLEALARKGIVQLFKLKSRVSVSESSRDLAFETVARCSQGWWPKVVNPVTGEAKPGIELIPPVLQTLVMYCPNGHEVQRQQVEANLKPAVVCGQCKTTVQKRTNAKIERLTSITPGFDTVRGACFDGLTSMCEWGMGDMADRAARGEITKNEQSNVGVIRSGAMLFGGNVRTHYGHVQTVAQKWVGNSGTIPGLAVPAVWTCLETLGDEGDRGQLWGPQLAGKAKTAAAAQWFGNYLGCQTVEGQHRLYLREFAGPDGIPHKYKTRVAESLMPEYLSDFNNDAIRSFLPDHTGENGVEFSGFNLGVLFALIESAVMTTVAEIDEEFKDLQELDPDTTTEVGGDVKFEHEDVVPDESQQEEEVAAAVETATGKAAVTVGGSVQVQARKAAAKPVPASEVQAQPEQQLAPAKATPAPAASAVAKKPVAAAVATKKPTPAPAPTATAAKPAAPAQKTIAPGMAPKPLPPPAKVTDAPPQAFTSKIPPPGKAPMKGPAVPAPAAKK